MKQAIAYISLLVRDYEEALDFYIRKLGFEVLEDTWLPEENKRWLVIAPPQSTGTALLLARAANEAQAEYIGNQTGGRVFLFLHTDDFERDYNRLLAHEVTFVRPPKDAPYGRVAVFQDLYGNLWDLLQLHADHPVRKRVD